MGTAERDWLPMRGQWARLKRCGFQGGAVGTAEEIGFQ